ncbi:MAG: DUF1926 domain-containing protein [Fibrobacter sp.]|jgi:hypothetical protein|nr:DUF1926 domain-containing protein [Fibrobacter sp.]
MKRHALALLLHPCKNRLMPKTALKDAINSFTANLLSIAAEFPHLRFNLVFPGYFLESIDVLLLSKLRELSKKGNLEWILTGYTEPFLSLSPLNLTSHNINHGLQLFSELAGETPCGFLPPFSNWEPFLIDMLSNAGLNYAILSQELFPIQTRYCCGYWMAEHTGKALALISTNVINPMTAPANFIDWLNQIFSQDKSELATQKFATVHYMIPLSASSDPFRWLRYAASEIDKYLLNFQSVRFSEFISSNPALGLQYVPSSLLIEGNKQTDQHFLNYLYSFDQIGILQRKLLDVNNKLNATKDIKTVAPLIRQLCMVQDINRLLPGKEYGFENTNDRLWSYAKLIGIERTLYLKNNTKGGQIRITDFLKNGVKSIILANKSLKAYIDNTNGGQIFAFDFRDRYLNLCAAYSPQQHQPPNILVAGKSRTWFIDHILPQDCKSSDLINGTAKELGNLLNGQFEYKVRKTSSGVRIALERQCSILRADRLSPMSIEKVYGLEQDSPVFNFVYQLSNLSLMDCHFKFATQLFFSFPGLCSGDVKIRHRSQTFEKPGVELFQFTSATKWVIEDRLGGVRLYFQTQKPFDIWCIPASSPDSPCEPSMGLAIVLSCNVDLEPSSRWKNIGKVTFRKIRRKGEYIDAL